jgi:hypothetical protein
MLSLFRGTDHMQSSGYAYALSVFAPESGMATGHYSREEIVRFLQLERKEVSLQSLSCTGPR